MISISLVSVHRLDCFGASISYSFLLAYLKMGYTMLYHVIPPTGHFNWESMIINSTIKMTTALFFWQLIATNLGFCWRESSQSAYIGMMSWFGIIWDTYGYMSFLFRIILKYHDISWFGYSQRPIFDWKIYLQQKLLQVPCYEDALNMILDFDDQDDGTSESQRFTEPTAPILSMPGTSKMVGETHKHGILRI